jgi:hypothetical protein
MSEIQKEFYFKNGVTFQRLNKDYIWYAIHQNIILDYDQYRNDLEERVNNFLIKNRFIEK